MLNPEEASALAGVTTRHVYRLVEAGRVHFREAAGGSLLVCLGSLLMEAARSVAPERSDDDEEGR